MRTQNRFYLFLAAVLLLLLSTGSWGNASAAPKSTDTPPPTVSSTELSKGWALVSANKVTASGATISQPGYRVSSWYPITVPSTVLAGLVANNVYQNIP